MSELQKALDYAKQNREQFLNELIDVLKIASISTAIFPGSDPMPTALRAPIPFSLPQKSANSSLHPLITAG